MRQFLRRLLLGSAVALPFALPATTVRGEDAAPPPVTDVEKKDDKNPAVDLKLSKNQGLSWRKTRAEYWQKKSEEATFPPRWFFHLGRHWQEAREYEKAVAAFERFFAWTPPADDQKAVADNQTNREAAHKHMVDIYFRLKKYDKSAAEGRKWTEDYSTSPALAEVWDQIGQAERINGAEDKAIEAFGKSAEGHYVRGYLDFIDMHVAAGRIDAAKAVIEKYEPELVDKKSELVPWVRALVEAVGTDIPGLDKTVAVYSPNDAPKDWNRVAIFYRFGSQTNNADAKLANIQELHLAYPDKTVAVGVTTYMHYNVDSRKVEPDLPKDKEVEGLTRLMGQTNRRIPPCIVAEQEFLDALHAKFENQITVVDTKGKLFYARSNEEKPYDYLCVELAVKHLFAEAK
jgi:tetratricopeptide (TPR) repeat protein